MEIPRNKQFILCAVLSSVMKTCAFLISPAPTIDIICSWHLTIDTIMAWWHRIIWSRWFSFSQKVNSSLMLHHHACVIHLTSSHHAGILSAHIIIIGRMTTVQYILRVHINITFIIAYCYNYSILLLVIVVNLLLCLIYKLNFIIGMYVCMYRRKTVYMVVGGAFGTLHGFRHPLWVLEHISLG